MSVKQSIKVTNAGLSPILSVAQGTGAIEYEFTVSDFDIPSGSAAVAYNIQPTGNIVSQICSISGNTITIKPPAYYFLRGKNYMQFQVSRNNEDLFSFLIEVWCAPNISQPEVIVAENPSLVSQLISDVGLLSSQIDNLLSIPSGSLSTSADAALADIKVGWDGTTYDTPGDAVRGQIGELKDDLVDLQNRATKIDGIVSIDSNLFDIGTMGIAATEWSYYSSQYRVRTKPNTTLSLSEGTTLSLDDYTNYRFIISYQRNKGVSGDYISSGWLQKDFVCPLDSNYVLMIARLTDTVPVQDVSELLRLLTIKKGESYLVTLTNRISNNEADIEELQNHIFNPSTGRMPTLYIVDGESLPIYANSFVDSVSDWHDAYKGMSMASGGISDVKYFNNGMLVKGDINDGHNNPHQCNIAFVNANETTKSSSIPIKVVSSTINGNKKVLCIGDSLTYGGKYLAQYRQLYKDDVLNIDFVGTIGQGTDASPLREGRSQWNTKAYCTQSSFAGATNAFMNPSTNKFDFPYYCSHNNINPDIVCIFLGTNELTVQVSGSYPTLAESEQYYAEMIASIRRYSATIPIVVWWCPIPCQINGGGGVTMGKKNRMNVGDMLRRNYTTISGTEHVSVNGVYILPIYAIISDSDYTINDIVLSDAETVKSCADSLHPTDVGHKKIAIALHGMLKYLASI